MAHDEQLAHGGVPKRIESIGVHLFHKRKNIANTFVAGSWTWFVKFFNVDLWKHFEKGIDTPMNGGGGGGGGE